MGPRRRVVASETTAQNRVAMLSIATLNLSKYQGLTLDSLTDLGLSVILKVWTREIEIDVMRNRLTSDKMYGTTRAQVLP